MTKPPPDRTDAIARVLDDHTEAGVINTRDGWTECMCGHREPCVIGEDWDPVISAAQRRHIADAILTTDDPAATAALAATLTERHPEQVLDALVKAGVLQGEMQLDPFGSARAIRREVTRWREG